MRRRVHAFEPVAGVFIPSGTMIYSGGATSTPIVGRMPKAMSAYTEMLSRELPAEAPPPSNLSLSEFFCCAGGIGLGFRSAGYRLAFANDISERAAESYAINLGHRPVVRDIRGVGPADYPPGEVDVVTGGFPCVTFSTAGKRLGVVDDVNGKLYLELCRVIKEIKPRYFVAENVEGMLSANGGKAVKIVLAEFLRLGYRTSYEMVNMAEHGVPQTRKRVIFVGVRLDQWRGAFRFPPKTHRLRGDKGASPLLPVAVSLADAIGDLPPPRDEPSPTARRITHSSGGASSYRAKRAARGEENAWAPGVPRPASEPCVAPTSVHPPHVREVQSHEFNHAPVSEAHAMSKRFAKKDHPSPTIVSEAMNVQPFISVQGHEPNGRKTTAYRSSKRLAQAGDPSPTMVTGGTNPLGAQPFIVGAINAYSDDLGKNEDGMFRRMTVRECARVQSFPDWYVFAGSQADGYRVIGNAVPPLYAKRLALAILDYDSREIIR